MDEVTFLRGKTADGIGFVFSYEGGPTALCPERKCRVSGMVGTRKLRVLTIHQAAYLRAVLPSVTMAEVEDVIAEA